MVEQADVERLVSQIERQLGPRPTWAAWPGGWPDQVELALLDAVFSIQARYQGVLNVVERWRDRPDAGDLDDLNRLATIEPGTLAEQLANHQKVPGGSQTKASAVVRAARNLIAVGVVEGTEVKDTPVQRRAFRSVAGLGPTTWTYLLMLLGHSNVKTDPMIQRFVTSALPDTRLSAAECGHLVRDAASHFDTTATALDRAIWNHQRHQRT